MQRVRLLCWNPDCTENNKEFHQVLIGAGLGPCVAENHAFNFIGDFEGAEYTGSQADAKFFCPKCGRLGRPSSPETVPDFPPDPDEEYFIKTVKLDKLVRIENTGILDPRLVHLSPICRFHIPTEAVVSKPEIVVPDEARVYRMNGRAKTEGGFTTLITREQEYNLSQEAMRLNGSWHPEHVVLVEVWADHGDDGHIHYVLVGWRAVTEERLRKEVRAMKEKEEDSDLYRGPHGRSLPECMELCHEDFDDE